MFYLYILKSKKDKNLYTGLYRKLKKRDLKNIAKVLLNQQD